MKEWWPKAVEAYRSGVSVAKVAEAVCRSTYSVKYVLRKMGVALRTEDESNALRRKALNAGTDWWVTASEMYHAGGSTMQIIAAVNRSPLAVRRALIRQRCYQLPENAPSWWDNAITLYGHGYPLSEIAELEHQTKKDVARALLDSGVYRKRSTHSSTDPEQRLREGPEWHAKAIFWYRQGKTLEEVGSMFGVTRERVRQVLGKYGAQTRSRKQVGAGRRAITEARKRKPCATCFKLFLPHNRATAYCSHKCARMRPVPWVVHASSLALNGVSLGKAVDKVGHDMRTRAAAVSRVHQFLRRNGLLTVLGELNRKCRWAGCGKPFAVQRTLGLANRIYCDEHRFVDVKSAGPWAYHLDAGGRPRCGMHSKRPMHLTSDPASVTCSRCKSALEQERALA